jgi:hypothetical protein
MFGEDSKEHDFGVFLDLLLRATTNVEQDYFQLPVAEREESIYRERVYCYELYHQIRQLMPVEFAYKLDGELDKMGHPLIQNTVGGVKPDFLVHERGMMNKNLVVIEVKPINATKDGVEKDVKTLCGFLTMAQYFRALYLFYGDKEGLLDPFIELIHKKVELVEVPKGSFYLMLHRRSGISAEVVFVI